MASYKVNNGISVADKRYEIGDLVDAADLPASSIKWMTEQGIIELVSGAEPVVTKKSKRAAQAEVEGDEF